MPSLPGGVTLLRLYPRAWRSRYGEEFLATVGDEPLRFRQVLDIVMMAIDAWLSSDVRNVTRHYGVAANGAPNGGGIPMLKTIMTCRDRTSAMTTRDGFTAAGVMLAVSFLCSVLGIVLQRSAWPLAAEILKGLAFPASFTLAMPWWLMKGSPWKAQVALIGVMLLLLTFLSWLATKI